ncbi:hypothetical protein [Amycolatopsis sp. NPDC004079]|uniref:hypothetical protein n=1 Tax=Amycolatopsis sp. NPDC004079 TaxID=3154549 RepID=UPI0033AD4EB1
MEVLVALDGFWSAVDAQIRELKSARNARDVLRILSQERNPYGRGVSSAPGFFAGSGGEASVEGSLSEAGWRYVWREASYHYCMRAPDGSMITYVEGDIYDGDGRLPAGS